MNWTKLGYQYNVVLNTFVRFFLANFVLYSETLRIIYMSCFFLFLFVCWLCAWFVVKTLNCMVNYRKRSVLLLALDGANSTKANLGVVK